MKNRKSLISKGIHAKRLGAKYMSIPKTAGPASFNTAQAVISYARPSYSFSAN